MAKWNLYNVAKLYIEVFEQMVRTRDPQLLAELEEKRAIWLDRLLRILKREGISFADCDYVTQMAYHIVRGNE